MTEKDEAKQPLDVPAAAVEFEQTTEDAEAELMSDGVDVAGFLSRVKRVIADNTVPKIAPPKNTGGGGFVFEEEVCAWLMLCMLVGEPPLEPSLGLLVRLEFQTRVDGWLLDDVLLTTNQGSDRHRTAVSIKSNAQFGATSAPSEFVLNAWQQWLQVDSPVLDRSKDFLGLVTGPMTDGSRKVLLGLQVKLSDADPTTFAARLGTPGWANEAERKLFDSFRPPTSLSGHVSNADAETASLAQRLRFRSFDFGLPSATSLKDALRFARDALVDGSADEAQKLWEALCAIAAELRPKSGHITRAGIVARLRQRFRLLDHPDYRADWSHLEQFSRQNVDAVPHLIAGSIPLPRAALIEKLTVELASKEVIVLAGYSGVGKSCVARMIVTDHASRTLWVDARAFENIGFNAFQASLGLQHVLRELLAECSNPAPVLVIDGLDRVFSRVGYATAATLLRAARQEVPATRWRIILPCQSQSWLAVADELRQVGLVDVPWSIVNIDAVDARDLAPVTAKIPNLARLLLRPQVATLMGNLKILDLIASRVKAGINVDAASWVGETNVASWFWDAEVDHGLDRVSRGRFARDLAERQGDKLLASIPSDEFGAADLTTARTLLTENLVTQVSGDRLAFAHDLYGDWIRLRLLINHQVDFVDYIRGRQNSPLWHRAIRLLGQHLLEQVRDLDRWRAALRSVDNDELRVTHDLLLDAPVFAIDPRPLLEAILPTLLADNGSLLRRLLTRFFAFATLPDLEKISIARSFGIDESRARALFRYPHWPYWIGVIAFLHKHATEFVPIAAAEVSNILEMWLQYTRKLDWAQKQAADIGVLLGREALKTRQCYGERGWHDDRKSMYRCALASAHVHPDEVLDISLTACARRGVEPEVEVKSDEENEPVSMPRSIGIMFGPPGFTDPWPDGPLRRVDEDFAEVALESPALLPLFRVRPTGTREIVLACLIEEPQPRRWHTDYMDRSDLNLTHHQWSHRWNPPLYSSGPFLDFLQTSFQDGLSIIIRLVDFATERELEYQNEDREARSAGMGEQTDDPGVRRPEMQGVTIRVADEVRTFVGGQRVFGWSAGGGNPPETVQAALMALEQYFYLDIDARRDVDEKLTAVLRQVRSVAFLQVLIDVGKKIPALFTTVLQGVLAVPELYAWDIQLSIQGRRHLMIGAFDKGTAFIEQARAFHNLEHRKIILRDLAPRLIFATREMADFFSALVASWANAERDDSSMIPQLRILLDPLNWEDRNDPEHGAIKVNAKLIERQRALVESDRGEHQQRTLHLFPVQCRTILDDNKSLSDAELDTLWETWLEIVSHAGLDQSPQPGTDTENTEFTLKHSQSEATTTDREAGGPLDAMDDVDGFPHAHADAIAGGVAVFVKHREWLDCHADRLTMCRAMLANMITNPPTRGMFDTPVNAATWTWSCFAAEALVMLVARDRNDNDLRYLLAMSVFASQYAAIELLFKRAAELRDDLGSDFERLRRLALEWSFVRPRYELLGELEDHARRSAHTGPSPIEDFDETARHQCAEVFEKWAKGRIGAFVDATSSGMPDDWSDCDPQSDFVALDKLGGAWRREPPDIHLLKCAHAWAPLLEKARDKEERARWVSFWRSFLRAVLPRQRPQIHRAGDRIDFPDENERWVLDGVALVILQATAQEAPDLLWTPVMDLGDEAHSWPELLMRHIHLHALAADVTPSTYEATFRAVVTYALGRGHRWSSHERVWDALIGIGDSTQGLWRAEHAGLVERLHDVIAVWMEKVPPTGDRLAMLAYWLAAPVGRSMRLRSIPWFAKLLVVDSENEIYDPDQSEDGLVSLLNTTWNEHEAALRCDVIAFPALQALLRWLVERQNLGGLELAGRLGGFA